MKLYIYQGLDNEEVPKDVNHVIVDDSVTVIKKNAFEGCKHLVSVIMGNNVRRIEEQAFNGCYALRFIRLSNMLEYIGEWAFFDCVSLEALFLPSTVKSIEYMAFLYCESLRLLILPSDIDLNSIGKIIIPKTNIQQIAEDAGVPYEWNDDLSNAVEINVTW